jgi:lipid A 3-O-deacylase
MNYRLPLLLAVLPAIPLAHSAEAPPPDMTKAREAAVFTIYFENDYFAGTDKHYTNGAKFSWLSPDYSSWAQRGDAAGTVGDALPVINQPDAEKNFGFAFGQNMYTPTRKDLVVPDPKDRPYAGWSYLEFSFLSTSESKLDTLSFQIGMVGPDSYAKQTQRAVHKLIGSKQALGWDYQLKNEVAGNIVYERKWRLYGRTLGNNLGVDFVPHAGASLGTVQTYANVGGAARLGLRLPSDFGVQLIRPGGAGSTPIDDLDPRLSPTQNWSAFIFSAVDGRAVARDIFLDGNTWQDSPSVDKEPFVGDFSYGVGVIAGRWQLTFAEVQRSREFKTEVESHNDFGSVTLSCAF